METQQPAHNTDPAGEIQSQSYFVILPWLVLAVALAITYQLWQRKQQDAVRDLQALFDFRVREVSHDIEHHLKAYGQALRGVQGMFPADDHVSRSEFASYVATLKIPENYPGIQSIRFSPVVTKAGKSGHVAAMRAEGFAGYAIQPDGERDSYAPVQYIEPFSGNNLRALGYDIYSESQRRSAMDNACDTDNVTISGKLKLVTESGTRQQAGFQMYLPVYKYGAPVSTLAERRASLTGWVDFTFRAQDLIGNIYVEHDAGIDFEIFDGEEALVENILYDSDDSKRKSLPYRDAPMFKNIRQISIAGHTWTLQSHSLPALEGRLDKEKPRFIAIAGVGASLLLMLLVWLLVHGRALALRSARSMNRELIESKEALNRALNEMKAITEANPDMMYVVNTRGELIRWSPSLERFLGLAPEQMMNKPATEFVYEEDQPAAMKWMQEIFDKGYSSMEGRMCGKDGALVHFLCNGVALKNSSGEIIGLTGTGRDITEHKQAQNLERIRNQTLELLAHEAPLADILEKMARWVEEENPGAKCLIALLDNDAECLYVGAAPSMPEFNQPALNGVLRDDSNCICRVSAQQGQRIMYENIRSQCCQVADCTMAEQVCAASCWSEPIKSLLGELQGTLTLCHTETSSPNAREASMIEHAASLASMAITSTRLREELRLSSLVLEHSSEGMLVTDAAMHIVAVNPAFTAITGYVFEEVKGKDSGMFHSDLHTPAFYEAFRKELVASGHWQGEVWSRRKNGEAVAYWLTVNTIRDTEGRIQRHVALFSDITEKKLSEELIWRQANFDPLTELPNRRMFLDRLAQEVKKTERTNLQLALLLIDLDQFKEVNDTLGHDVGDILLKEAARRVSDCVRESDTVARLGGDEFTVILAEIPGDPRHVETVAQKIIASLAQPYPLGNETAYISASIGITLYPADATGIDALLKNADQAMYVAKSKGRNRFSYFTPSLQESAQARLRLSNDLRGALAGGQFRVHFQPIIELASGRIHKAEALIRWQHPVRGMVSPGEFIPLTEETGLIHDIGDWVFKEAAHWAARWSKQFSDSFQVSVNMSPVQFRAEGSAFSAEWLGHLQQLGISGRNIVVEITEGLLLNAEPDIIYKLLVFRDAGIQVAIDDFGTGHSSLSYLKKFDIDYLKIDQSFVRTLASDPNDLALSEAIIVMAHKLGLKVIAEGVETEEQRRLLAAAGCDYAQGFLFSHPLAPQEFEAKAELGCSAQ